MHRVDARVLAVAPHFLQLLRLGGRAGNLPVVGAEPVPAAAQSLRALQCDVYVRGMAVTLCAPAVLDALHDLPSELASSCHQPLPSHLGPCSSEAARADCQGHAAVQVVCQRYTDKGRTQR